MSETLLEPVYNFFPDPRFRPEPLPAAVAIPQPPPAEDQRAAALEQFRAATTGFLATLCHPVVRDDYSFEAEVFGPLRERVTKDLHKTAAFQKYARLRRQLRSAEDELRAVTDTIARSRTADLDDTEAVVERLVEQHARLAPLEAKREALKAAVETIRPTFLEARRQAETELNRLITEAENAATASLTEQRQAILNDVIESIEGDLIRAGRLGMSIQRLAMPYTGTASLLADLLEQEAA